MEIEIRDARPEDAAAVHEILVSPHVIHGTMRLPFQTLQQTEKRIGPVDGMFKLVAVSTGAVVGFCELVTYPEIPRHRHVGDVNIIVTAEGWQGKGVGRALMEATIDLADNWLDLKRLGLIVWTDNDRAIGLYESLGFVVEGTHAGIRVQAGGLCRSANDGTRKALAGASHACVRCGMFLTGLGFRANPSAAIGFSSEWRGGNAASVPAR